MVHQYVMWKNHKNCFYSLTSKSAVVITSCPHCGRRPAISQAGSNLLSQTSFGTHSAKALIEPNDGRIKYEAGG